MRTQRRDFIAKLRQYADTGGAGMGDEYGRADYRSSRIDADLAAEMARWLENNAVIDDDHANWFQHLPRHVHQMLIEFRTDDRYVIIRRRFRDKAVGEIPHPTDCHVDPRWRGLHLHALARMFGWFSTELHGGEWLKHALERMFYAQETLVSAAWWCFVSLAYKPLMIRIKEESHRGNAGDFGITHLMTWAGMGRVMFTFRRGKDQDDVETTFIADDSDSIGVRSGSNYSITPYQTRISMIEDVIAHWDIDKLTCDTMVSLGRPDIVTEIATKFGITKERAENGDFTDDVIIAARELLLLSIEDRIDEVESVRAEVDELRSMMAILQSGCRHAESDPIQDQMFQIFSGTFRKFRKCRLCLQVFPWSRT